MMSVPLTFAKLLLRLVNGESLPVGQFASQTNKKLLQHLVNEKALFLQPRRNTHYVYCPNAEYLRNCLREQYGIPELEAYIELLQNDNATGSDAAKHASNSKLRKGRVFPGFFVKTYLELYGTMGGMPLSLHPCDGTWIYVAEVEHFEIDEDITVVGVENPETFRFIERYRYLFSDITPLFLLRYENNSYLEWLQRLPNNYRHFGDFDLSGLAIYIKEFRSKLGAERCRYVIPNNINQLIAHSKNRHLYLKQLDDPKVKSINFEEYPEIVDLAKLIMKHKTTVEQEALMESQPSGCHSSERII